MRRSKQIAISVAVATAAVFSLGTAQVHAAPSVAHQKHDLMNAAGIPWNAERYAVDYIVSHESSWQPTVWNTTGSGAYGLCQASPASKMASAGADYMTNPVTQLRWCAQYARERYGGWMQALSFWQSRRWW